MARISMKAIAWLFAFWVIGWYVFSVEAALFAPPQWYWSDILHPIRMALYAWVIASSLIILETVKNRWWPGIMFGILSLLSSSSVAVTTAETKLGGGAFWSLYGKDLDLITRSTIGLVFLLAWLYVAASPWLWGRKDKAARGASFGRFLSAPFREVSTVERGEGKQTENSVKAAVTQQSQDRMHEPKLKHLSRRKTNELVRLAMATIAGLTGAWFVTILGRIVPQVFELDLMILPGVYALIPSVLGLQFGYYLGASLRRKKNVPFVFAAAALGWFLLSSFVALPPLWDGAFLGSEIALVSAIFSAFFAVTVELSDTLEPAGRAHSIFEAFCSKVLWFLLWIYVGLIYVYPMFLKSIQEPISPTLVLGFVTLAWAWATPMLATLLGRR